MSKERELLARVLTSELWSVQEELQAEIKELLAQPEPEPCKPLSDDETLEILINIYDLRDGGVDKDAVKESGAFKLVRAIEKMHGITGVADE